MSLQVWLPLTKDLRQQGLSNVTVVNNGTTFNSAGKLGGCYQFNGSAYLYGDSISVNMKSASLWIKLDNTNNQVIFADYKSKLGFGIYSTYLVCSCADNTIRTTYPKTLLETNVWTHIVIIRRESAIDLYINGILQTPGASKDSWTSNMSDLFTIGARSNGSTCMTGYMNDFRMYDHCLSPMEVKELAKGLVLHYPLNRQGWGQENLAKNTNGVIIDGLGSTPGSRHEYYAFNCGTPFSVNAGDTVTVSFDLYETINTAGSGYLYVYNTNNKGPHQIAGVNVLAGRTIAVGDIIDERISFTTTVSNRSDATQTNDFIEFYSNYGTSNWFKISNLKVEKGSIPTPWCPNSADALATTMGLNSTIEYDCSGFCNNGTKTGTFTWTSDTPKYSVSQVFEGSKLIEADALPIETYTLSAWINWAELPSGYSIPIFDTNTGIAIGISANARLITYIGSSAGGAGSQVNISFTTNTWYHIVVVKTGATTRNTYINGELKSSSAANYWAGDLERFLIGGRHAANIYKDYFKGKICDVRAYATALSADDVKSLYQNCATIDPDGTIRGQIRS